MKFVSLKLNISRSWKFPCDWKMIHFLFWGRLGLFSRMKWVLISGKEFVGILEPSNMTQQLNCLNPVAWPVHLVGNLPFFSLLFFFGVNTENPHPKKVSDFLQMDGPLKAHGETWGHWQWEPWEPGGWDDDSTPKMDGKFVHLNKGPKFWNPEMTSSNWVGILQGSKLALNVCFFGGSNSTKILFLGKSGRIFLKDWTLLLFFFFGVGAPQK